VPAAPQILRLVTQGISAKDRRANGHSLHTVVRLVLLAVIGVVHVARAAPCPPAVALTGDDAVVSAVRAQLGARGIAPETSRCPGIRARVERRGAGLVVGVDGPDGVAIERAVGEVATAATVIESWTRGDLAAPLLASRGMPERERAELVAPVPVAAPPAERGMQLFAGEETTLASDGSAWLGLQLGACVMLGPVCIATRLHGGKVISEPASLASFERKGAEAYLGIDVPIAVGRTRFTPGFAAGYGTMFTRYRSDGERMGVEISGPRAEVHAAFSLPLSPHFALDVIATAALTQAAGIETHGAVPDPVAFPAEPRALFRLAIGVRYGAL